MFVWFKCFPFMFSIDFLRISMVSWIAIDFLKVFCGFRTISTHFLRISTHRFVWLAGLLARSLASWRNSRLGGQQPTRQPAGNPTGQLAWYRGHPEASHPRTLPLQSKRGDRLDRLQLNKEKQSIVIFL